MKTKKIKQLTIFLLLLPLCVALLGAGCNEDKDEYSAYVEGYVVGSFQCNDYNERGFCIILENETDSIYTFTLSENIFDFPEEIIKSGHDANTGGPFFFPDSLMHEFKIKFKYREPNDSEIINCLIASNALGISFSWEEWCQVIVTDVTKFSK